MRVRFGIMADAHVEFMHDGAQRLAAFLAACKREGCDFCVDLGDFCPPGRTNEAQKEEIREMLSRFSLPFYHILGNHDTDENTKAASLAYIGCENQPKSFDFGGVHFVLLDACAFAEGNRELDYENGNYRRSRGLMPILPRRELKFLSRDLADAKHPTVLFSHQSLIESRTGIRNAPALRRVIESAPNGVLLSICGHEHVDRLQMQDGVYYLCLNSMSYYWAGESYKHETYGGDIDEAYPMLKMTFPYRDPLFAIVDITDGEIRVMGREAQIVGAKPQELAFKKSGLRDEITASISDRILPIFK